MGQRASATSSSGVGKSPAKRPRRKKSPTNRATRGGKGTLIVVESPAKAKTLRKYLGPEFVVKASVGHVRDLPQKSLSVDLENGFEPTYEVMKGKASVLKEIRSAAKSASQILLAPDPDREGEAIAWHLAQELGPRLKGRIRRITFNEITKKAVMEALEQPEAIDQPRFESQQARRILDRIVGYQLSPLLWLKVRRGLSAGRVQSVVVRILVEREQEIRAFVPEEYWTVEAIVQGENGPAFVAKVVSDTEGKPFRPTTQEDAAAAVKQLEAGEYCVESIEKKQRRRKAPPPFITSRLQQAAAKKLHFTAKRTMTVAQQLYEGVELGSQGSVGLITYMRTDSSRVSDDALNTVRSHILETFGKKYLPAKPLRYASKKTAQDAHEAIRPTSMNYAPEQIRQHLSHDQFRLYSLIWRQFVASQMTAAVYDQTTAHIEAGGYKLKATGSVMKFNGYLAAHGIDGVKDEAALREVEETMVLPEGTLPPLREGEILQCHKTFPKQHFTKPPPRFTESSLVKELEELGIGRPSTYATILSTIVSRGYAKKEEGTFFPTDLGELITELLVGSFPRIMDIRFTAKMESDLDEVERGRVNWVELLTDFYHGGFKASLEQAKVEMRNVHTQPAESEHICTKCQAPMVKRMGRHGAFFACRQYPECKFTMEVQTPSPQSKVVQEQECPHPCKICGGKLVLKRGRFGSFFACLDYPKCKGTRQVGIGIDCPQCEDGELGKRKSKRGKVFFGCGNYPDCTFATWDTPLEVPCPQCDCSFLSLAIPKRGKPTVVCPKEGCGFTRQPTADELQPKK